MNSQGLLADSRARSGAIASEVARLQQEREKAVTAHAVMQAEKDNATTKLQMAERLLGVLAKERDRWSVRSCAKQA
jgi:hypothetical protein